MVQEREHAGNLHEKMTKGTALRMKEVDINGNYRTTIQESVVKVSKNCYYGTQQITQQCKI